MVSSILRVTRTRSIDAGDSFASLPSCFFFNLTPFSFGFFWPCHKFNVIMNAQLFSLSLVHAKSGLTMQ
jgi:hypothetical protein